MGERLTNLKRFMIKVFLALSSLILIVQFTNCSKYKPPNADGSSTSGTTSDSLADDPLLSFVPTKDLCEDDLEKLFLGGYYRLVRVNCATCHMQDSDKPQFASKDYNWAYSVFKSKGYQKVSEHATSPTHKPPYTGLHLTTEVNSLKTEWEKGLELYNVCKGLPKEGVITDPEILTTIQTTNKPIPVLKIDESSTIVWDLTKEVELLKSSITAPNFGAKANVEITVTHRKASSGEEYYTLKSPRIFNNATGVIAQGLRIKLNTRFVNQQTTFTYMKAAIPPNTADTDALSLLASGAMVLLGKPTNSDTLNLAFEVLKDGSVQPPPPPTLVKFTNSNVVIIDPNVNNPAQYIQNFQIQAAGQVPQAVVISVLDVTELIPGCGQASTGSAFTVSASCLPQVLSAVNNYSGATSNAANRKFYTARSIVNGGYNRFDWDFRVISDSLNLVSSTDAGGQLIPDPQGIVTLRFSKDIRKEDGNRLLRLRITVSSPNGTTSGAGAQQDLYVVILKVNNPDPTIENEVTYSGLMNPTSGIIGTKCIKCHNSVLFNGGYDIADYEQMISRGILIPGDPMSEMYRRTNSQDPINIGKSPMPANGGLSPEDRDLIKQWILSGAKNN